MESVWAGDKTGGMEILIKPLGSTHTHCIAILSVMVGVVGRGSGSPLSSQ